jgi:hypothetical protein|tara:strand:+ start:1697 stop:2251 length:555 start_codon:yes stop_codon:yes gene_type:complete
MKKAVMIILALISLVGCHKEDNTKRSINLDYSYENSLAYYWGDNYTVHRIDSVQGHQVASSQYFNNNVVLNSLLIHYGQDTTSFTDSFRDTLTQAQLNNYLAAWGSSYDIGLDTIYKDFWNSHGTICYSPSVGFIDANSTKIDEEAGVASHPLPHKSFTIMIPLSGGGNEIVYHLINNSTPPSY